MESKLPKPSGLKKPTTLSTKPILPTDRLKSNSVILKQFSECLPLSRDLTNLNQRVNTKALRAGSPELPKKNASERIRLRRSRSVCDLRDIKDISRPLKRHEQVLPDIPAKVARFGTINTAATKKLVNISNMSKTKNEKMNSLTNKKAILNKTSSTSLTNKAPNKSTTVVTLNKKIPAYDYKARFADLLEKHKVLKEKFETAKEQLGNLDSLPEKYEESQNQIFELETELHRERTQLQCLQQQNNAQTVKINCLTKNLGDITRDYEQIKKEFETNSKQLELITKEVTELRSSNKDLAENVDFLTHELEINVEQLFRYNMERKELHNTIMDLRDECSLEITNLDFANSSVKNKIATNGFTFDHVFHPRSTQEDVFEMVSPLIQSALDGYNICIFAYGQTGSGKTYTMDGVSDNPGIIPRTVDLLFKSIEQYKRLGWVYEIKATFLEIYNEVLYDLLSNEQKDMEIRMVKNSKNDIYVSNITEEHVTNAYHLKQLMIIAKQNRATAATVGNERSSRSHAVTRIDLIGNHEKKSEISIGTINLVDLAGSESPKTSIRMTETKNINRSLSELTNVILALLQKQDYIPYRNSKLTHLLMPSLGGNSKTLMFINVSPLQDCYVESVKSLRFAQSVNSCKLAKAKKNRFLNVSGSL
ncbi:protein claret segregational isoform X2 [Condylostylus longicornis]|uniref:protein claret segregational isoform X2 n=1 Tax=Condylostylus longicornis TaxID=2530218 RepID=UPI00244DB36B|nr:protein claret segregational isoform X2 [Condylostylus longicornis]